MGDIEAILKRKFLIVNTWDIYHRHMLIVGFSSILLIAVGSFLWLICSMTSSLLATIFLLVSQIVIGLPATRAYYDFGVNSRNMLKFYDTGVLHSDPMIEEITVSKEEMFLVFERMGLQLEKSYHGSLDDLNDLAWFAIIVWSIISSLFFFQEFSSLPVCSFGAVILVVSSLISYYSGFQTSRDTSFEEYFNHFQFYVEEHIRYFDSILPSQASRLILKLIKLRKKSALVDIIIEFKVQNTTTIEYHFGLPSNRNERFIIDTTPVLIDQLNQELNTYGPILSSQWTCEQIKTQSGLILRLINQQKSLNFADMSSIILSPSVVQKSAIEVGAILTKILGIVSKSG